jgi:hypothetical protein
MTCDSVGECFMPNELNAIHVILNLVLSVVAGVVKNRSNEYQWKIPATAPMAALLRNITPVALGTTGPSAMCYSGWLWWGIIVLLFH